MKDWTGNSVAYSKTLGASSHSNQEREVNDYYATEPKAVKLLLEIEKFEGSIWECACGEGSLSEEMKKIREIVVVVLAERVRARIKVKQPLQKLKLTG